MAAFEVVEVGVVAGGADAAGLCDAVERAPQAAVVAQIDEGYSAGLGYGRDGVLGGRNLRGGVAAVERVGGVAEAAGRCSRCDRAAVEVDGSDVEQGAVRRCWSSVEREVVASLRDGGAAAADLQRAVVDAMSEGGSGRCAGVGSSVAQVLPEALVEVVEVDGEGVEVAGDGLHGQRSAKDGAVRAALAVGSDRTERGGEVGSGLHQQARPGGTVGRGVVAVGAHRREELASQSVPYHRGRGVADCTGAERLRLLDDV